MPEYRQVIRPDLIECWEDEDDDDTARREAWNDYDIEDACADCGAFGVDACCCCGAPLCMRCGECSAGFCDACLKDPEFSTRMEEIHGLR